MFNARNKKNTEYKKSMKVVSEDLLIGLLVLIVAGFGVMYFYKKNKSYVLLHETPLPRDNPSSVSASGQVEGLESLVNQQWARDATIVVPVQNNVASKDVGNQQHYSMEKLAHEASIVNEAELAGPVLDNDGFIEMENAVRLSTNYGQKMVYNDPFMERNHAQDVPSGQDQSFYRVHTF